MRRAQRMWKGVVVAGLLLSGGAFIFLAAQQQQTPRDIPAPVLRVTTRLVLVDAIVTDKQGKHVDDLTAADFTVLEEGKPQRIAGFDLAQPSVEAKKSKPALQPLPPNVYTNRTEYRATAEPLTVLLLDALNTPVQDQSYARMQMLNYLDKQVQPNQQVAVYTLGEQLRVLQDFTDDIRLLKAAVQSFAPSKSTQQFVEDVEKRMPAGPRGNVDRFGMPTKGALQMYNQLREFISEQARVALDQRVGITLSAFQIIARGLAGYPGRKNLVWVSGSFPIATTKRIVKYGAEPSDPNYVSVENSFEIELQKTSSQLTDAQISVYPVDARGLVGSVVTDASSSGTDAMGIGRIAADYGSQVSSAMGSVQAAQASMEQMASETGGRAYFNRNDVDNAVALSVNDSNTYYMLSYYPEDKNWDGKFHKIQVKVNRPGLEVRHRNGYFSLNPTQWDKQRKEITNADLMSAMRPETPLSTMVIFDTQVIPPAKASKMQVPVDVIVDPRTLSPEDTGGGGKKYRVELHVAAYSQDGKLAANKDSAFEPQLTAEKYAAVQQQGFPLRSMIELAPGSYRLRIGVRDMRTGFIGTVDVPLPLDK